MSSTQWQAICSVDDLVAGSGVAVLVAGQAVAVFYLPDETPAVYALDNVDPVSGANVMARGLLGDVGGELVVASPVYKEHFSLCDGHCLEKPEYALRTWPARLIDGQLELQQPEAMTSAA